jgi:hypothetical protein
MKVLVQAGRVLVKAVRVGQICPFCLYIAKFDDLMFSILSGSVADPDMDSMASLNPDLGG